MTSRENIERWVAELNEDGMCDISDNQVAGLIRDYNFMAVRLANAESKCRGLAAENAHARDRHVFIRALAVSILEHSGGRMDWRGAMEDATELLQTVDSVYAKKPATDAFLAEVRAQARNEFINELESRFNEMTETLPPELRSGAAGAAAFVSTFRKGAAL